jgi:hypothetical protein
VLVSALRAREIAGSSHRGLPALRSIPKGPMASGALSLDSMGRRVSSISSPSDIMAASRYRYWRQPLHDDEWNHCNLRRSPSAVDIANEFDCCRRYDVTIAKTLQGWLRHRHMIGIAGHSPRSIGRRRQCRNLSKLCRIANFRRFAEVRRSTNTELGAYKVSSYALIACYLPRGPVP